MKNLGQLEFDEFSDQINDRVLAIIAIKTYW